MAKNKKPRKKYRPDWNPAGLYIPAAAVSELHSIIRGVELATEIKLPRGTADFDDVSCVRDIFNVASVALVTRSWLSDEYREQASEVLNRGKVGFHSFYNRVLNDGIYTCTGEELTAIRDGVQIAADLVHWSLENEPRRFIREFIAMKRLLNEQPAGRVRVTADAVARSLRQRGA